MGHCFRIQGLPKIAGISITIGQGNCKRNKHRPAPLIASPAIPLEGFDRGNYFDIQKHLTCAGIPASALTQSRKINHSDKLSGRKIEELTVKACSRLRLNA